MSEYKNLFCECEDEFLEFERIEKLRCSRPDINAFLLLNELFPDTVDIICSATHDVIWLDIDCDELRDKATPEQLVELHRCGVRDDRGQLCMFT